MDIKIIPGNFDSRAPTSTVVRSVNREDPNFVHQMTYGTPKRYINGFRSMLIKESTYEGATKEKILNVLYALERFFSLNICQDEDVPNESHCHHTITEMFKFVQTLNS